MSLTHELKAIYTIWLRDVLRFSRDRARIFSSLGQPILFLVIFGLGLSPAMSGFAQGQLDYTSFLFPGIVAMAVLFTAVFSAVSIVWDREFGFLKEVLVAPVSRVSVALGKVAGGSTVAMFQGVIILLLAPVFGIPLTLSQIVVLLWLMLLTAATMTSLGVFFAARMRSMEGFHMIINFVMMPVFFLSGAFFPLRGIPLWMEWLARLDPMTYGVDPIRQVVLRHKVPEPVLDMLRLHPIAVDVALLFVFWMALLIPAVWAFARTE